MMKKYLNKTNLGIAVLVLVVMIGALFAWRSCTAKNVTSSHVFRIARDPRWYPLELGGREINMVAFTNELMVEIARDQKFRIELLQSGTKSLHSGLDSGNYDAILTSITPSAMYHDKYLLSDPIYLVGPVIVMRIGEDIKDLDNKEGRIIAVQKGNTTVIEDPRRYPQLQVKLYHNMRAALDDMVKNQIDAVIMDAIPAHTFSHGLYQGKIKVITDPLSGEGIRLVALNDSRSEALIESFNKGLQQMTEGGSYIRLITKWDIINTSLETEKLEMIDGQLEYKAPERLVD